MDLTRRAARLRPRRRATRIVPNFSTCVPPALVEVSPPIVQLPRAPSVSGKRIPTSCAASCSVARTTPASATASRFSALDRADAVHPPHRQQQRRSVGGRVAPAAMPVLPPCGTSGTRCSAASRTISATSSVEEGARIAGDAPCTRPRQSVTHGSISRGSVIDRLRAQLPLGLVDQLCFRVRHARAIARLAEPRDSVKAARMDHPPITIVVARAQNGVIGRDGKLPWHLPGRPQAVQGADDGQRDGHGPQDVRQPARTASRAAPHRPDARPRLAAPIGAEVAHGVERRLSLPASEPVSVIGGARHLRPVPAARATRSSSPKCSSDVEGDTSMPDPRRFGRLARDVAAKSIRRQTVALPSAS